jgi:hypothetical protein
MSTRLHLTNGRMCFSSGSRKFERPAIAGPISIAKVNPQWSNWVLKGKYLNGRTLSPFPAEAIQGVNKITNRSKSVDAECEIDLLRLGALNAPPDANFVEPPRRR